jgi:hypothetical protein
MISFTKLSLATPSLHINRLIVKFDDLKSIFCVISLFFLSFFSFLSFLLSHSFFHKYSYIPFCFLYNNPISSSFLKKLINKAILRTVTIRKDGIDFYFSHILRMLVCSIAISKSRHHVQ